MGVPALPQELVECIIDLLWDLPSTLKSCSLVSRAWWPRCQHHLRSIVALSDEDSEEQAAFFRDPSIASFVRQLTIRTASQTQWIDWFPRVLPTIESMTRVTRLRIHSRNWDAYLGDGYFRAHGRSLVHLTLDGVQLDSFTTFTYTIAAFPKLESLSLLYVRWAARLGPARREDWADGRALNLKTLRMGWVFSTTGKLKEIVEWLRRGRTSPLSIERLALGATYPSDGDLLTVLPLLAPTLLHVEIFQRIHDIRGLLVQALDATLADPHFVRLKSVTVTGITYDSDLLNAAHYDAQVEEQLPLLARRDGIEVSIKMAYQDPRWFEIPPVTS